MTAVNTVTTDTRDATPSPGPRRPVRLLLADDHRMLRDGLRRSMVENGFDVVGEAANGEEAVRLARELRPDVVLMDVTMPVLDGIEATRLIRSSLRGTEVVVLTMHGDADVMTRALQAGAVGYLVKDCSTEEVASAVHQAAGEGGFSPELAASMLNEAQRDDGPDQLILSARELEVLQLVADGFSLPEVAATLYISAKTVKNHLASIYQKLDARDRTQAVMRAVRIGIVKIR
jgi:DNA-binding NarL/FixJ family response regulator